MRIGDVERLTGLSRKTIRFYEEKGLLGVVRRDNSYREYDETTVERLRTIALLRRSGISLCDIQLWQDSVITTSEMLHKRLYELRDTADTAADQGKLCRQLLDSLVEDRLTFRADVPDEPQAEEIIPEGDMEIGASLAVGVDIGTTTIKAVVLDLTSGRAAGVYALPNFFQIAAEQSFARIQDAESIYQRIEKLLNSLIHRYPTIRSIGFTGQMHGIVYVDKNGRALSPLYTWQDERAGVGIPSAIDEIRRISGYALSAGYGLATHYYETLHGTTPIWAHKICTIMDYVASVLCGREEPIMHVSDAASLGFWKTTDGEFDREAIAKCGMDPAILPKVTAGYDVIGTYHGIPVSVAIGDNQASFLGSVREPEISALANFGTGSQVSVVYGKDRVQQSCGDIECRPYMEDSFLMCGSALCGGRAYALLERFFREYIRAAGGADGEQYEVMNRLAARAMEKENILHVRTTFSGTRSDAAALGEITGIGVDNFTPESLTAGVLCGMAEELSGMYDKIKRDGVSVLVGSGNALRKNPVLRDCLEKAFGMKVCVTAHHEEAAYGAAMFSALAAGTVTSFAQLKDIIRYE